MQCGYTFDAGPNAVLFTLEQDQAHVLAVMLSHFPAPPGSETAVSPLGKGFVSAPAVQAAAMALLPSLPAKLVCAPESTQSGAVRFVYVTSVGDGPRVLKPEEALADATTGMPLASASAPAADGEEYAKAL